MSNVFGISGPDVRIECQGCGNLAPTPSSHGEVDGARKLMHDVHATRMTKDYVDSD